MSDYTKFDNIINNKINGNISVVRNDIRKLRKADLHAFIEYLNDLGYDINYALSITKYLAI